MAKVLITGGAGFIGLHLARRLVDEGCAVLLVDNFARAVRDDDLQQVLEHPAVQFADVDCLDAEAVATLPTDCEYIVHLAAIIGVTHVMQRPYRVVVDNLRLLDHLIAHAGRQAALQRLMFASTSEVTAGTLENFGLQVPTPETVPLSLTELHRPRTSYMLSKMSGEALCHYSGLPFTIFRPHNVYGPRMGSVHVIPEQLRKAHEAVDGATIDVPSADQTRSFCYVDDATEMLFRMMTSADCEGATLNLGTESPQVRIRDVVRRCWETVGRSITMREVEPTPGSPARRAPDMSRSRQLIGYDSRVSLEEGVSLTYDWYRRNVFASGGLTAR